ncbi:MAG: PLP-dependent aminotransferase family protein [Actinomycetota bacterium]|nr:PLP-dependent aminotransferase family protein [Actinomycetota bacterium]
MSAISFARGVPSPDCIPVEELADCARAVLERDGCAVLSYGPAAGYAPLREWIARRHGVEPERIVLTNGSLQGFVFLAQRLCAGPAAPRVLVEAPTYDRPLKLLHELGAELTAVPLAEDGLDLDALESALRRGRKPAFLYTIPTFQNPTGRTLSTEHRRTIVEIAREHDVLVLEDDPYGLVRFEGDAPPTLFELDGGEHVLYSSSFSKTVAPGLRVGYLILPRPLAAAVEALAVSTYISPVFLSQATVYEFLRRGALEANLARACELLCARRDAMLAALERELAGEARWSKPEGGYFLWLDFAGDIDAAALLNAAGERGVTFVKGSDFFACDGGGRSSARLAYSFVSPEQIGEGVARLAELVARPLASAAA